MPKKKTRSKIATSLSSRSSPHTLDQLKKENIFLDQIIENLPNMIFIKEAKELRFVRFNKAGEDLLGFSKKMMLGKNDYDFFTRAEADFFTREDRKVLRSKELRLISEEPIHTKKKGVRILRTKKVPLLDEKGKPVYLLGVSEDITGEKETVEALRESEERFRSLVTFAPFYVLVVEKDGKILFINKTTPGYDPEKVVGKKIYDFIPESNHPVIKKSMAAVFRTGKIQSYETQAFNPKGDPMWFSTIVGPIKKDGKVISATLFSTDVTRHKEAEANLKIFQTLMNQSSDSVFVLRPEDGKFVIVNRTASEMLGWSYGELLKMGVVEIDELIPTAAEWKKVSAQIKQKGSHILEGRLRKKDGPSVTVEISVRHLDLDKNEYFIAVVRDVTERKKLEKMVLDISDQEKRRIGQDLHDDLGQELSAVSLMGKVIQRNLEKEQSPVAREMDRMLDLVKNCIDKTRLLSRGLSPVDLRADGLAGSLEDLVTRTEEIFHIPCSLEMDKKILISDPTLALQIFRITQEAVHNAVKHAKPGRIQVALHKRNGSLLLSVSDNGIGLPRKNARKRKGIGLAILQYRAHMVGGSVEVSSPAGAGTVVSCRIPFSQEN